MSTAYVTIPFAGHIQVAVDFDGPTPSEDELIDMAMEIAFDASYAFQPGDHPTDAEKAADARIEPGEWEYHRKLMQGNFVYVSCTAASVDMIDDEEYDQ